MSTSTLEQPTPTLQMSDAAPKAAPIVVTDRAASEVKRIVAEQGTVGKLYLRLRVVGGGCSGFQHPKIKFPRNRKIIKIINAVMDDLIEM